MSGALLPEGYLNLCLIVMSMSLAILSLAVNDSGIFNIASISGTIYGSESLTTQSTGLRLKNLASPSLNSLYRTPNFTLRGLSSKMF